VKHGEITGHPEKKKQGSNAPEGFRGLTLRRGGKFKKQKKKKRTVQGKNKKQDVKKENKTTA